mgnify:CR=1 FL=1
MEKESLDIYVRGETVGVVDKKTGRNHRLKTLGMLESFTKVSDIIERSESINNEGSDKEEEVKYNRKPYKEKVKVKSNTYQPENSNDSKIEEISEVQKEINRRKEELEKSRKEKTPEEYSKTRNR